MEQRRPDYSRLLTRIFIWIPTLFIWVGCKSQNPNPELADPIYNDLENERRSNISAYEAEKKNNESIQVTIQKPAQKADDIRQSKRELEVSRRKLLDLAQKKEYFEIRAEQRKAFVQKDYLRAFDADLPWPNPDDAAEYKAMKRLRQANLNWDARVPKSTRNLKPDPAAIEKAEKEAAKASEHGGSAKPGH